VIEFDAAFQARHLAVPRSKAITVAPEMSVRAAAEYLRGLRFDQAPVESDGELIGFVITRFLDGGGGSVGSAMTRLGSGNVVSADASVGQLLDWIIRPGFLFVLEGRDVTGFITVSDFNKQPARAYLYTLLARLEVGLAELIRRRFGVDQAPILELLSAKSRAEVEALYRPDVGAGEEGELVAYLDFSDLVRVVERDDSTRAQLVDWSAGKWKGHTGGLVDLRNNVMHPVRNVVLTKGGLEQLQKREQRIRQLIQLVDASLLVPA
jgi:CBS domain-containing protein